MSSQKTPNLNMHKWVATDPVQRTEFNDNFQKIDDHVNTVTTQLAEKANQIDLTETNANVAEKATQLALNATNNNLALKVSKTYVDDQLAKLANGAPKGPYANLAALQAAFPTGTAGVYLTQDNGHIYYWNGTAWTDLGAYQSALADASSVGFISTAFISKNVKTALEEAKNVVNKNVRSLFKSDKDVLTTAGYIAKYKIPETAISGSYIDFEIKGGTESANVINLMGYKVKGKNKFNKSIVTAGKYVDHNDGILKTAATQSTGDFMEAAGSVNYTFSSRKGLKYPRMVFFDANKVYLGGFVGGLLAESVTFLSPPNTAFVRVSADTSVSTPEYWQVEEGSAATEYTEFRGTTTELFTEALRLRGVGTYKDILDANGSAVRKIGEKNIIGTETWYAGADPSTDIYYFYITGWSTANNALTGTAGSGVATSADGNYPVGTGDGTNRAINLVANGNLALYVEKAKVDLMTGATVLDKFKTYLATYPINFIYRLKTETTEQVNINPPKAYAGGLFEIISDLTPNVIIGISTEKADEAKNVLINEDLKLESAGFIHKGGNFYTAFAGGVMLNGKEIHVFRCGTRHTTINGDFANVVAYIKDKYGKWTTKILNLGITGKEIRDVNLTLPYDGTDDMILSGTFYTGTGTAYTSHVFRLDKNFNVLSNQQMLGTEEYFSWGNYLFSPSGVGMKTGYDITLSATGKGVRLLRKLDPLSNTYDSSVVLFPSSAAKPTETTIGYWGNKLVSICRQNDGFSLYTETLDLEGATGWSVPVVLPFKAHAPNLQQYTPKGEPLILTFSSVTDGLVDQTARMHRDVSISATFDGINWHKEKVLVENNYYGGYNTFVNNGDNRYGMAYHDDYTDKAGSDIYYKSVQLEQHLTELSYLKYKFSQFN